jgi:superfamily II DNA or RNA helicase
MIAKITDNHFIYLEQLTSADEQCIIERFSVRDPRAYYISTWDGWYRRYNSRAGRLALPFLDELVACCAAEKIPLEIRDERPALTFPAPPEGNITKNFLEGITLTDYQIRSIQACCRKEIGLISAAPGAGKTEVMCGVIKALRCPSVIITEQIVVLEQIVERLALRSVVRNDDIGIFCHGYMPDNNVVMVGSIQSLSTPPKPDKLEIRRHFRIREALQQVYKWAKQEDLRLAEIFPISLTQALYKNPDGISLIEGRFMQMLTDYMVEREWEKRVKAFRSRYEHAHNIQKMVQKCDLLLVDEADLAVTQQYAVLFRRYFTGRRRFGFTGTPSDKDKPVQSLLLKENLGNVIVHTDRTEVEAAGRIVPVRYYMIAVGEGGNRDDNRAYDIALKEEIIENGDFHQLVADIVSSFSNDRTLILIDTAPIMPLGVALQDKIPGSRFVYGGTPIEERQEYQEDFESGKIKCIIGSKIYKRGLDLRGGVDNLIIIGGGAKWSDYDQKIGRAVRVNTRGWVRVFGFFILNNKYLYRHSRENLKAVVSMGYPAKLVIGGTEIDGRQFIKSQFRLHKIKSD